MVHDTALRRRNINEPMHRCEGNLGSPDAPNRTALE
jgi:hypothetical protein